MPPPICKSHKTMADHTAIGIDGRILWRCSECGLLGSWGSLWTYYGNLGCKRCWEPRIDRVLCWRHSPTPPPPSDFENVVTLIFRKVA